MTSNTNTDSDQKEESSFKISYFGMGGRAAPLRMAAVLGGLSFTDEFMNREQLGAKQAAGTMRWKGLPEVTVYDQSGKAIVTAGQSNAILRYIGTLAGLYPKRALDCAFVDEILDACEDIFTLIGPTFRLKDDAERKVAREALLVKEGYKLPYFFSKFESRLEENEVRGNKNGFIAGDSLTIADLKFYGLCGAFTSGMLDFIPTTILEPYKRISAFVALMSANEKLSAYYAGFTQRCAEYKAGKGGECMRYQGKFVTASLDN